MTQVTINGPQKLSVSAEELALILDSLAVQPFNKVNGLINKITQQVINANRAEVPQGNANEG